MKSKTTFGLLAILATILFSSFSGKIGDLKSNNGIQDTIKKNIKDSLAFSRLKLFKTNAHASYYADKLNGRRTASGKRFDNNKYTAAHRKFPFGTRLKITNETNGKSVIVEVNDRGPFIKGRDLDLTKKAFMEIAGSRYGGSLKSLLKK